MITRPAPRALNKPMLILGIDRKLAGLSFILSVIVAANGSKVAAVILFVAMWTAGRRMTRLDPNIFLVLNQVRKQKSLYDPAKGFYG